MVLRKISSLLYFLLLPILLYAQDPVDSTRSRGKLSGEWRTFYMGTINKGDLKDFHALATGGYIKYAHTFFERLEIGGALYTSLNLNIQDLEEPDPTTGRFSRYEAGLFDVNDLSDRAIFVIGELYARYKWQSGNMRIGRMRMKTPFVNGQDGRMIPTMIQGFQVSQKVLKNLDATLGIYNEIGPRSTAGYFGIGESIGKYPVGRGPDGNPSGYRDQTESDFMIIADAIWKPLAGFQIRAVNYYVQNVFNALYLKPGYTWKNGERLFTVEGEWMYQNRVGDGGNPNEELRYFTDNRSNIFGLQVSTKKKTRWRLAYNRITDQGRFLFPREWGREFLFTFQKRERSEGNRDAHALILGVSRPLRIGNSILNSEFTAGRHWNPAVSNAAANKYAMPDYLHFNLDIAYSNKKLPRFAPEILITHKSAQEDVAENPNLVLNKVDMWQFNLIFNYRFM